MSWACLLVAGTLMFAREAQADDNSLFLAGGPLVGVAVHDGPNGALIGGEVSAGWVHYSEAENIPAPFWLGAYADVLFDTATDTSRISIGPEYGYSIAGVDAGVVHELGGSGRWGFSARASVSIPVSWKMDPNDSSPMPASLTTLSFYVRGVTWRGDTAGHAEIGLLLKFVLPALAGE